MKGKNPNRISASMKKEQLINLAKTGGLKPSEKKTSSGKALSNYVHKSSASYDTQFDAEIRRLRPDWFEDTARKKKDQLLDMARRGEERPHHKTNLGRSLNGYVCKKNKSYDANFDAELRKLAPKWFENSAQTKKNQLLEMAKKGMDKPIRGHNPLAISLSSYIRKTSNSYDHNFFTEIRKLAPHWFRDIIVD